MKSSGLRSKRHPKRRRRPSKHEPLSAINSVEISNQQRRVKLDRTKFVNALLQVLEAEGVRHANLEIALVTDSAIRKVHDRFLQLDSPTDVLTFPLHEPGESIVAEIIISADTAAREGPSHRLKPQVEILLYAIHGILHLCGYDDHSASDARRMRRRQEMILRRVSGLI